MPGSTTIPEVTRMESQLSAVFLSISTSFAISARYYELTNFLPDVVDVAIDRKKKVSTLPDWPEIKIFYFDPSRMETGVAQITEGGDSFRIL